MIRKSLTIPTIVAAVLTVALNAEAQRYHQPRSSATPQASPQPVDTLSPFWSANPELELSTDESANLGAYARKSYGPVKYILLGPEWESKDDAKVTEFRQHALYDQGYVRLGGVNFIRETDGKGDTPEKEQAIAFAHRIGADVVIYRA